MIFVIAARAKTSTYAIGLESNQFMLEHENEGFQEEYLQEKNNRKGNYDSLVSVENCTKWLSFFIQRC